MLRRLRIENLALIHAATLDLVPGLNVVTGETGAGKTIFAQAIGLLLGARGDASAVGPAAAESYVEAELDPPTGFFDDEELAALDELRPAGETELVLARRVFADGRTRAYAWGRAVAREDAAAACERLIGMSGQFQQRRLARPGYQLDVLDAFAGSEQAVRRIEARDAWRALAAARRRYSELTEDVDAARSRLVELEAVVEATDGLAVDEEDLLRAERDVLLHATELGEGAFAAAQLIAPDDGEGAAALAAAAERALAPLEHLADELAGPASELRDLTLRLQEVGSDLRGFVASLERDPSRLEVVEERLERISDARRRFRRSSLAELLALRAEALAELEGVGNGRDPIEAAQAEIGSAKERMGIAADALRAARTDAARPFADAVSKELRGIGMGDGEFRVELLGRELGATGSDEVAFLVRPNSGMPLAGVAQTASGGELSRIALAIAAVAASNTMVFDEIDAGIGGVTAHRVAETLRRLAGHAQVIAITHLPQVASVADRHFRVEKVPGDPTHTRIEALDPEQRSDEIERMLGGEEFLATVARPGRSG